MYATQARPDIAYATKELARCVAGPTEQDMVAMRYLLRYLRGTQYYVMQLGGSEDVARASPGRTPGRAGDGQDEVVVIADANWAEGPTRRSTSGGVVVFQGTILLTYSRTQPVVALSTCEAELLAISTAAQEGLFVKSMLQEAGVQATLRVRTDSSSAKAVAMRRGLGRMKHLDVRYLWLQDAFRAEMFSLDSVSSEKNIADALTKKFAGPRHRYLTGLLGLRDKTDV
jgi:hypothetical protein